MSAATGKSSREMAAGLCLALAALLGILFENTETLRPFYDKLLGTTFTVGADGAAIAKPVLLWINDGLMAIFFFLVALEIKKEIVDGSLSSWQKAALPIYGAVGGIVVPTLIFLGIVGLESVEAKGWAIPAATDIAFALGVLSILGRRVPSSLKAFLLAIAVVDDLAAIVIIAVFYTADLSTLALALAMLGLAVLAGMNIAGVRRKAPYILVGVFLWACVLKSGVHATLAGVALGFAVPMAADREGRSPLRTLEHGLSPYVAFLIMPAFAFANAGVPLGGLTFADLTAPLTLAIAAGLFLGKQIGVFGAAYAAIRTGVAAAPIGASLQQIYGVALLAGIGFTMSLFIGSLAFTAPESQNAVRLGVLIGSLLSGLLGAAVLAWAGRKETVATASQIPGNRSTRAC